MSLRGVFRNVLIIFPFAGIGIVISLSAYSGCPILDSPFAFLGEDCQTYGVHWNNFASPIGILSIFWIIIGPVIWIVFRILEAVFKLIKSNEQNADS